MWGGEYSLRICFIHSYYSADSPSGENQVVDNQISLLREQGHEVEIISLQTDILREEKGYKAKTALNVSFGTGPDPMHLIRRLNPDLVHVHNLFPNWGTHWLSQSEFPLVSTIHNFRPICAAGTLYRNGALAQSAYEGTQ